VIDLFAKFDSDYGDDLNERPVYRILDYRKHPTYEIEYLGKPQIINFQLAVKLLISNTIE
jgi:hypothetical protein